MIELKQHRSLTSKRFNKLAGETFEKPLFDISENKDDLLNPIITPVLDVLGKQAFKTITVEHDGQYQSSGIHVGHVHYEDKLGGTGLRSIDWTLNWDETKRGWGFTYHSFRPFLPEYADEWVEFRDLYEDKDQTVKYKAIASHVKGRLVMPEEIGLTDTGVNCVIYDDAFGEGIDYILYFTRTTLKKVVRIRDGYKQSNDMTFDFEVDFPKKLEKGLKKFRTENKEKLDEGYEFIGDTNKRFDTKKQLIIGDDKKDGKEWFTYLRDFKCWDSEKEETISVDYIVEGNISKIRKIVPSSFLENSVGDVFTDTTTSFFAGAGDGSIRGQSAIWNTVHDATAGNFIRITDAAGQAAYSQFSSSQYSIWRSFFPFLTSSLPDDDTISAATFSFNVQAVVDDLSDANSFVNIVQTSQASSSTLGNDDFNNCGAVDSPTLGASNILLSALSAAAYTDFALNATGIGWIDKTGTTLLGMREGHDINDADPGMTTNINGASSYYSEQTGTDKDPILEVIHSSGGVAFTPRAMIF